MAEDIGTVTTIGAQKFNERYLEKTRRIMFCGIKVSKLLSAPAKKTQQALKTLTDLQGEEVRPSAPGAYIDIHDVSPQNEGGYPVAQVTTLLNSSIAGLEGLDKIHEIGIYAQICQNDPPTYSIDTYYRAGDIVRRDDYSLYRCIVPHSLSVFNAEYWQPLPRAIPTHTLTQQRWYPVVGSEGDPFLFYIVAKHDYPLCLSYNLTLRYTLNIQLLNDSQLEMFYMPVEDMHGFPEVQLAYLENISQAMRAVRNEQRIGQVAINSLGPLAIGMKLRLWDVVSYNGKLYQWVLPLRQNEAQRAVPTEVDSDFQMWPDNGVQSKRFRWLELTYSVINKLENYDHDKTYEAYETAVHNGHIWRFLDGGNSRDEPGTNPDSWEKIR